MIWVTGDMHRDYSRFSPERFPEMKMLTKSAVVIICGDAGFVWYGGRRDDILLNILEDFPFTTVFVSGNHENFAALSKYPIGEWNGGKVQFLRPHVIHLMRGQIFTMEGHTFFTMGGASSHDIEDGILDMDDPNWWEKYVRLTAEGRCRYRILGRSWWPEELPSEEEYAEAVRNLDKCNWRIDYILTHCAPTSVAQKLGGNYAPDRLTDFLETIKQRCRFHHWFLGHYHQNRTVDDRFTILWEQMLKLEPERKDINT